MDAAYTLFKKTSLFFALALFVTAGVLKAQPSFSSPTTGASFALTTGGGQVGVSGSADASTPITYSAAITGTTVPPGDPATWVTISGGATGTTPGTITFQLVNTGSFQGTYSATVTLSATSPTGVTQVTFTVTYASNSNGSGGQTGLIVASPASVTFGSTSGSSNVLQSNITLSTSSANAVSFSVSFLPFGSWLNAATLSTFVSANSTATVTVSVTALTLTNNQYTGSVTIIPSSGASTVVPVTFNVGAGGGTGTGAITASPNPVNWSYTSGGTVPNSQFVSLATTTGATTFNAIANTANGWLDVSPGLTTVSGTIAGGLTLSPNTAAITQLVTGVYQGTVAITDPNGGAGSLTVNLTVNQGATPGLTFSPSAGLTFTSAVGFVATAVQTIQVTSSISGTVNVVCPSQGGWLQCGGNPQTIVANTATAFSLSANPTGLLNSTNDGQFAVQVIAAGTTPLTGSVPIAFIVGTGSGGGGGGGGGTLTLSPTSLTYSAIVNGASPAAQNITVSASASTNFTVTASTTSGGTNWLILSQSGGIATSSGTSVTVFVVSTGLAVGTYNGFITFTANGINQTVPVALNVTATSGGTATLTADRNSVALSGQAGASTPATQAVNITTASGSAGVSVTVSASTSTPSGGNWLSVSPLSATTGATFQITASASLAGLAAGNYNGTITVTPSGGTPLSIPVSLAVTAAPTVSAAPTSLIFTYRAGDTPPAAQTITVSGGGSSLAFTATASSAGSWLIVSPASGTTTAAGAALSVSISPASLNASTTPYTGTITVAGTGTATGTTAITVSLTVTAPLPTVSKITNAGSFATATAIAPGEIITLFASDAQHPIGPTPAVGLTLDSTGKVATTIGGVQVLAAGFACPMIFVSATQVSAVVPYELASFVFSGADVLVKYLGQTSNAVHVNVSTTQPGLFTANSSGTGPGAILNSNSSVNSPANPAARGDTVVVYMTGEGQTTPLGVTGKVTTVASTGPLTPTPLLPISILIGPAGSQLPANYSFAGEAPGFVSGAMQLNVQIPPNATTGDQPIVVSIGPNSSQAGVTVSIK
ncbi:MAG TPA: hypothetical protein VNY05_08435 [Candidatus Acidoferrales bacterium]|nr:hypothetical protein [Candidatus Acidoferrales bacterium]